MSATSPSAAKVALAVLAFGTLFLEGRVIMDLWRWFVVPLGAVPVGYWHALGLGLLTNLLARQNGVARDTDKATVEGFGVVTLAWVLGWLFNLGVKP